MKILQLRMKAGKRRQMSAAARFHISFHFTLLLAFFSAALSVNAQSYSINWYKIAGGGGVSAGGAYQMNGTIGQPDAGGAMNGGNFSLTGGFWSQFSLVQTPGAPPLYISSSGNAVTVYWQNVSGCTLQQNGNCVASTAWTTCPCSPVTSNGTNYVNVACTGGRMFFRLCRP
jgi:hypothetical protein